MKHLDYDALIEAIENSRETIDVMIPSRDYYARAGDCYEDRISIINPDRLIEYLRNAVSYEE